MKTRERIRRWRADRALKRAGFADDETEGISGGDRQQLWEWMRGATGPLETSVGLSYGVCFGMAPPFFFARWLLSRGSDDAYALAFVSAASMALFAVFGMIAAWAVNEHLVSKADYFYSYGRARHGLIASFCYSLDPDQARSDSEILELLAKRQGTERPIPGKVASSRPSAL